MLQRLCLNFKTRSNLFICCSVFKDLHGMISDDVHFANFFTTVGGCDLALQKWVKRIHYLVASIGICCYSKSTTRGWRFLKDLSRRAPVVLLDEQSLKRP